MRKQICHLLQTFLNVKMDPAGANRRAAAMLKHTLEWRKEMNLGGLRGGGCKRVSQLTVVPFAVV